ncbi:uncharacterized protein LOC117175911 [Belonocnema kinseyi]|uniref:uncharacterized protein LOC117175911 n=1 Tax=Belonocnema kinseyi TaxID=2817044 RepID=UPI00143D6ECE|nr:uncharacterized protein LOC117175911 [Belonocnema kinseyi]
MFGTRLVAEDDGTLVADEDDVMYYAKMDKAALLLEDGQTWFPENLHSLQKNTEPLGKQRSSIEMDQETNDVFQIETENAVNEILTVDANEDDNGPAEDDNGTAEDPIEEMPLEDQAVAN